LVENAAILTKADYRRARGRDAHKLTRLPKFAKRKPHQDICVGSGNVLRSRVLLAKAPKLC